MPAKSIKRDGETILQVETTSWEAEIALTVNANMTRLKSRKAGAEILRSPASMAELRKKPEVYGIPLLFPPNRISGGVFSWNGLDYALPVNEESRPNHIHGLALGKAFKLERAEDRGQELIVECSFEFGPDDQRFAGFPHEFRLSLLYSFIGDEISQTTSLINDSAKPMPFGLGFHSAFNLSSRDAADLPSRLTVTSGDGYWELDQTTRIPTGRAITWPQKESFKTGQALEGAPIARLFPLETALLEGKAFRGAVLESSTEGTRLIYEFDEAFKHCAIWNDGGGKDFICIEPMTWMTDAPKLSLPESVSGFQSLAPGARWSAATRLTLSFAHPANNRKREASA